MGGKSEGLVEQRSGRGSAEHSEVWRGEWPAFPVSLGLNPDKQADCISTAERSVTKAISSNKQKVTLWPGSRDPPTSTATVLPLHFTVPPCAPHWVPIICRKDCAAC